MAKNNKDRLPLTRKEQIWYLIKNETWILFLINFFVFLFLIPVILIFFFGVSTFHSYTLSANKTNLDFFNVFLMYGLLLIPALFILCIGFAGLMYVIKQLAFESTTKFVSFFIGIKKNFSSFFPMYLLLSIACGMLVINFGYNLYIEGNQVLKAILIGANVLLVLTLLIAIPFYHFEACVFNNYFLAYLRNSVYLFYKAFPLSLINLLLTILPIVLIFFIPISVFYIPLGMLATFYISLSGLIQFIICLYTYEKIVPKDQIKEIYHKGLEDVNL